MRTLSLAVVMLAACSMSLAAASPVSHQSMAKEAQQALELVTSTDGPGAVVLIAQGDTVLFRGARGRAEIELGVPLTTNQIFRIASVTKMFTAAMVIKLAEQGKLSLDDALAKYLPDFPNAGQITLRQLLNHTSGISDIVKDPTPGFMKRDVDTAALIAEIRKRPPNFAPGTRWSYSNAGYILLGAVIEKVTGQRWYEALQKTLLDPSGLTRTRYGDNAPLMPGRVAGYTTDNPAHRVENATFISMSIPAAAGGLVSTADDLWRWMRALSNGRIVSREDFQQMITPAPELPGASSTHRYGLGMYSWRVRGNPMVGHTGQIDGFASAVAYLPKQDITVVVLANDDNFDAQTMARRLAAIALGEPYAEPTAVAISDDALRALAGVYRIDDMTTETLFVKDGRLYAQRSHHHAVPMQMTADRQLHFQPDELNYFVPVRNAAGKITGLDYFEGGDAPPQSLPRVTEDHGSTAAAQPVPTPP